MATPAGATSRYLPAIQPLTARSVVLSTLLGYHPPALPVSALVRVGALFGVTGRAIRTALTRMVTDGDLRSADGVYELSSRLLQRQTRQDAAGSPPTKRWNGTWEIAVVTSPPRPLADRVALRKSMVELRLAELREGVWTRPANLRRDRPAIVAEQCTFFDGKYEDSASLVATLWNLPAWADEARQLRAGLDDVTTLRDGFLISAEVIRHLLVDPCLPPALLPADWPGPDLRARYHEFNATYAAQLRDYSRG